MQISDDQFVDWCRRLNQSDRSAFEALFRTTYPALVAYARRFTGSEAAAEDVVQEAFLRIWNRRSTLDPARSLRALLYVSVRRLALNALEKQSRQQPLDPDMHRATRPTEPEETADVERRFDLEVEVDPPSLAQVPISVYLPQAEHAETVIADIAAYWGYGYRRTPTGFVLQGEE